MVMDEPSWVRRHKSLPVGIGLGVDLDDAEPPAEIPKDLLGSRLSLNFPLAAVMLPAVSKAGRRAMAPQPVLDADRR